MPAIRSGWPDWSCSAEFSWIDLASRSDLVLWMVVASLDPAFARIGIVQPTRHAKAASQRESPADRYPESVRRETHPQQPIPIDSSKQISLGTRGLILA
jgi:hypothetical protein